jgi:hypothetical protein
MLRTTFSPSVFIEYSERKEKMAWPRKAMNSSCGSTSTSCCSRMPRTRMIRLRISWLFPAGWPPPWMTISSMTGWMMTAKKPVKRATMARKPMARRKRFRNGRK